MQHRIETIPLFPLDKILFPKMILPLHIFEERYKEMIGECLERDRVFGVLETDCVEQGAVGTTARIEKELHRYEDGRLDILAMGEDRFRILELIGERAFLQARVQFFEDVPGRHALQTRIHEMLLLYRAFIQRLGLELEQKHQLELLVEELADEERELSYVIGQTIGLDSQGQRELLAETSPEHRVDLLTGQLRKHNAVHRIARDLFEGDDFDPTLN